MTSAFTIECRVHFNNRGRGSRKRPPSDRGSDAEAGRVPRVSRLMALAMRLEELIRSGKVTGYAELARRHPGGQQFRAHGPITGQDALLQFIEKIHGRGRISVCDPSLPRRKAEPCRKASMA